MLHKGVANTEKSQITKELLFLCTPGRHNISKGLPNQDQKGLTG